MSEPGTRAGAFRVVGIVNVTPDSFSDGGLYLDPDAAIAHARDLEEEGAAILDIGGESTRPGAEPVGADEERRRVLPVIEGMAGSQTQLCIDTSKASVAAAALQGGQPGPMLGRLDAIRQVLLAVVQHANAAKQHVETALAEAQQVGAEGN